MLQDHYTTVIIGAGPAGLIAAIEAYDLNNSMIILEKMDRPALKLKISGKGRCNITNHAGINDFIARFGKNGKFLKYSFSIFFVSDLLHYFEKLGVQCKLERGGRYFPVNDNAMDIVNALLGKVKSLSIPLFTRSEVTDIQKIDDRYFSIYLNIKSRKNNRKRTNRVIRADKIILATGGKSYPQTGSSGAGYKIAVKFGHTITPLSPSLVPLNTQGPVAGQLQGLSLKNVTASIWCENKKIDQQFGEMIFTDSGVSGPIIQAIGFTGRLYDQDFIFRNF